MNPAHVEAEKSLKNVVVNKAFLGLKIQNILSANNPPYVSKTVDIQTMHKFCEKADTY
jgi:hypothetical protein